MYGNNSKKCRCQFPYGNSVDQILVKDNRVVGIKLENGNEINADIVLFNGDPRALELGLLGDLAKESIPRKKIMPRSLSAYVWSFSAKASGVELAHHNVFFNSNYKSEFEDIVNGMIPRDPTLYICAQGNNKAVSYTHLTLPTIYSV